MQKGSTRYLTKVIYYQTSTVCIQTTARQTSSLNIFEASGCLTVHEYN